MAPAEGRLLPLTPRGPPGPFSDESWRIGEIEEVQ
jgi:hypothetical protein